MIVDKQRGYRIAKERERRSALVFASHRDGADPLEPALPHFAASALRHPAMNRHEPDRLFRHVVRWFDSRFGDETKVAFDVQVKPLGHGAAGSR